MGSAEAALGGGGLKEQLGPVGPEQGIDAIELGLELNESRCSRMICRELGKKGDPQLQRLERVESGRQDFGVGAAARQVRPGRSGGPRSGRAPPARVAAVARSRPSRPMRRARRRRFQPSGPRSWPNESMARLIEFARSSSERIRLAVAAGIAVGAVARAARARATCRLAAEMLTPELVSPRCARKIILSARCWAMAVRRRGVRGAVEVEFPGPLTPDSIGFEQRAVGRERESALKVLLHGLELAIHLADSGRHRGEPRPQRGSGGRRGRDPHAREGVETLREIPPHERGAGHRGCAADPERARRAWPRPRPAEIISARIRRDLASGVAEVSAARITGVRCVPRRSALNASISA